MNKSLLTTVLLVGFPLAAFAQAGPTQDRSGLPNGVMGGNPVQPSNSFPAGGVNAQTGPQSRPAYPSGSTTANPGAAFVRDTPKPSTGPLASPPGNVSTTTVTPTGATTQRSGGPGVGQAATPPK